MQHPAPVVFSLLLASCGAVSQDLPAPVGFIPPAIAYSPRVYSPAPESIPPSRKQIADDLSLLRATGFRSILTYSAAGPLGSVPEVARQIGFDGLIVMGIWDPSSDDERDNALGQARFVDAYCVGNEGLGVRYDKETLSRRMEELRSATGHPVTTSEPIDEYLSGPHRDWLRLHSDWLFPIAHSYWAERYTPKEAVDWIVARYDYLAATARKAVIVKEAGMPSVDQGHNGEDLQTAFFETIESSGIPFFYFEAFDQPWKSGFEKRQAVEANWGLFNTEGFPKNAVEWIAERWSR